MLTLSGGISILRTTNIPPGSNSPRVKWGWHKAILGLMGIHVSGVCIHVCAMLGGGGYNSVHKLDRPSAFRLHYGDLLHPANWGH